MCDGIVKLVHPLLGTLVEVAKNIRVDVFPDLPIDELEAHLVIVGLKPLENATD